MAEKFEKDTVKELSDGEKIKLMMESDGWKLAFENIKEKILDLQNVNNVDVEHGPEAMAIDLKARKLAADYLYEFLQKDIFGRVEQHENNQRIMREKTGQTEDSFVERHT